MRLLALACLTFSLGACSKSSGEAPSTAVAPSAGAPVSTAASAGADEVATSDGLARIVPIHHATFYIEHAGKILFFDPFSEGNLDGRPKADVVFITHDHPDHLDPLALEKVKKEGTITVAPAAAETKIHVDVVMKNGDARDVAGVHVEAVPAYNLVRGPSPGKLFHDEGRGNGYVLTLGDKRLYVSGDTECTHEMKALSSIDVAFVCMNLPYTMTPAEAGACVATFKPKVVYPYHYRDSNLADFTKAVHDPAIEIRERAWY